MIFLLLRQRRWDILSKEAMLLSHGFASVAKSVREIGFSQKGIRFLAVDKLSGSGFRDEGAIAFTVTKVMLRETRLFMEKRSLTVEEFFYFAFLLLLSVAKGFGFYEGQLLFKLLVAPALLCGLMKILISPYTKRQWAVQAFLLSLAALVYWNSREIGIFFILFTIMGMKGISLRRAFRLELWIWSVCALALCAVSFFRIEDTVYRVSSKLGLGYLFRWSLGFTHPNTFHITYLALCAFYLCGRKRRFRFRQFALLMAGNALVFFYSLSYTGLFAVTLLLVGELYVSLRPRLSWPEKALAQMVLPGILIVSFLLPLLYAMASDEYGNAGGILGKLNRMVNTRIHLAGNYLEPGSISLFGMKMSELAKRQWYLSIDNSYMNACVHYGIFFFALLMAAYFALVAYFCRKQKNGELAICLAFLVTGLTEPLLFNTSFKNVTLFFLGELLFEQRAEEGACTLPALFGRTEKAGREFPRLVWLIGEVEKAGGALGQLRDRLAAAAGEKKRMLAAVAAGAFAGFLLCALLYRAPAGYVVPRKNADWKDETSIYLESAADPAYAGYRILNYLDQDTPMQLVTGNAVFLESARYYLGSAVFGGLAGGLAGAGMLLLREKRFGVRGVS